MKSYTASSLLKWGTSSSKAEPTKCPQTVGWPSPGARISIQWTLWFIGKAFPIHLGYLLLWDYFFFFKLVILLPLPPSANPTCVHYHNQLHLNFLTDVLPLETQYVASFFSPLPCWRSSVSFSTMKLSRLFWLYCTLVCCADPFSILTLWGVFMSFMCFSKPVYLEKKMWLPSNEAGFAWGRGTSEGSPPTI